MTTDLAFLEAASTSLTALNASLGSLETALSGMLSAMNAQIAADEGSSPGGGGGTSPTITGFSPSSGPAGTDITFTGSGFGATQGTGYFEMGGITSMPVVSWSDTLVVATVPSLFTVVSDYNFSMINDAGQSTVYGPPYFSVTV